MLKCLRVSNEIICQNRRRMHIVQGRYSHEFINLKNVHLWDCCGPGYYFLSKVSGPLRVPTNLITLGRIAFIIRCLYFLQFFLYITSIFKYVHNDRSVVDPWHYGMDPYPRFRITDLRIRIRILPFSSVADKMQTKKKYFKKFFSLFLFEGTFISVFKYKKSKKQ